MITRKPEFENMPQRLEVATGSQVPTNQVVAVSSGLVGTDRN